MLNALVTVLDFFNYLDECFTYFYLIIIKHPGGETVIRRYQIRNEFKDATTPFEDFGHSRAAIFMLKKYLIGTLVSNINLIYRFS